MNTKPLIWFNTLAKCNFTGYGGAGNNFIMELQRRQYPIVVSTIMKMFLDNMVDLQVTDLPQDFQPDIQIDFIHPYRQNENSFFLSQPAGNSMQIGKIRLLFTMFESKVLPWYPKEGGKVFDRKVDIVNWADDINDRYCYDGIIVPSQWCADVFKNNGVKCPIYVVPLGVDINQFPYLERPINRDMFTFLHQCFYINDRKGWDITVDAFKNLKDKGELKNSQLITKWVPFMTAHKQEFTMGFYGDKIGINGALPHAELLQLLHLTDFSMNPTSGEGFGLIPLEHMATGLPVAVSNNTGCQDYLQADVNFPINCFEQPNWFKKIGGMEMRPDPDHVEEIMLWAYNHREECREMGRRAAKYVRDNWTYEHATDKLVEVFNAVL